MLWILDRPRLNRPALLRVHLCPEDLLASLVHPDPVGQVRQLSGGGVVAGDGVGEQSQGSALEVELADRLGLRESDRHTLDRGLPVWDAGRMVPTILVGVALGGLVMLSHRWRAARAEKYEARGREQLAAIVLYEEMKAAISALDLALRHEDSRWLASMSESRTLSEAWREHGGALLGLGVDQWEVLSAAVTAMTPGYSLLPIGGQSAGSKSSLTKRRELLLAGTGILLSVKPELAPAPCPPSSA